MHWLLHLFSYIHRTSLQLHLTLLFLLLLLYPKSIGNCVLFGMHASMEQINSISSWYWIFMFERVICTILLLYLKYIFVLLWRTLRSFTWSCSLYPWTAHLLRHYMTIDVMIDYYFFLLLRQIGERLIDINQFIAAIHTHKSLSINLIIFRITILLPPP